MRESLWRVPCEVAPRSAEAISGRLAYGAPRTAPPSESTSTRPRASTTMTRPPRRRPCSRARAASAVGLVSRPEAAAATACAPAPASALISLSTRREKFRVSGTSSAMIAKSRT